MLWLHRKKKTVLEPSTTITISKNTFYEEEHPATSNHHMLCVAPKDGDESEGFGNFMRLCAEQLLSGYPNVLEAAEYVTDELHRESFVSDFVNNGGRIFLPRKDVLFALSGQQAPRLISYIPSPNLCRYAYDIFAFSHTIDTSHLFVPSFDLQTSDFALHLFCHEQHDYFLMESTQALDPLIAVIRSVCQKQNRALIIE